MPLYTQLVRSKTAFNNRADTLLEFWNAFVESQKEFNPGQDSFVGEPIFDDISKLYTYLKKEVFSKSDRDLFLIVHHQTPIGFTELYFGKEEKGINISKYFIRKESRGKGSGTKMLKTIQAKYKKEGYKFMTLGVFAKNKKAISVYKKAGMYEIAKSMYVDL